MRSLYIAMFFSFCLLGAQEASGTRSLLTSSVKKNEKKEPLEISADKAISVSDQSKEEKSTVPEATAPENKKIKKDAVVPKSASEPEVKETEAKEQGVTKEEAKPVKDDMDDAEKILASRFDKKDDAGEKDEAASKESEKDSSTEKTEKIDSGKAGSGETGSGETGSGETGSGETGSGETGSGETGEEPDAVMAESTTKPEKVETTPSIISKLVPKEVLEGPKKPETPVEKAESGIVEDRSKDMIRTPEDELPTPPPVIDIEKEAEEKQQIPLELTPPECLPSSLDTTGVDAGGNWVIKRAFWEQAEKTYEKIMKANNELYDQQVKYMKSRTEVDKKTDTAFRSLGFEHGQLQELLSSLVEDVKNQREQQGELSEPEREFLQTLKEKQRDLEQFQLNLTAIGELENSINKVMSNLAKQIASCRKYEKQAWEHFKSIGKELNDKKARLLFYEMEGFLKTVEKNHEYVSNELWKYFNDTAKQIDDHLTQLKTSSHALKEKGTDLNKEYESFVQKDKEQDEQEIAAEKEKMQQELADIERRKKELEKGFFGRAQSWFVKMYKSITWGLGQLWGSAKGMIGMK